MNPVVPREHGAWGMLLAPFLAGAVAGGWTLWHLLLGLSLLAVFCGIHPLLKWVKHPARQQVLKKWGLRYLAIAIVLGLPVLLHAPVLGWLFVPAALMASVNVLFALRKQERHLLNDLAGIVGLVLGGVAACLLGSRDAAGVGLQIAACFTLYFFGVALYVKTILRNKGNLPLKVVANLYPLAMAMLALWLPSPWLFAAASSFSILKAWLTPFNASLRTKTLGLIEIANLIWFTTFLVLSILA